MEQQTENKKLETYNSIHEGYAHIVESLEDFWGHAKTHGLCDTSNEELDSIKSMEVYLGGLIKKANYTINTLKLMREKIFEEIEREDEGVIN